MGPRGRRWAAEMAGEEQVSEDRVTESSALAIAEGPSEATQEVIDEIRAEAEAVAGASDENEFGRLGRPFDRKSPFYIGFLAALGVVLAVALAYLVVAAGQILV